MRRHPKKEAFASMYVTVVYAGNACNEVALTMVLLRDVEFVGEIQER